MTVDVVGRWPGFCRRPCGPSVPSPHHPHVCRTPEISCEAPIRSGFVSFISLFGSSFALRVLRGRVYRAVCNPATRNADRNGTANPELAGTASRDATEHPDALCPGCPARVGSESPRARRLAGERGVPQPLDATVVRCRTQPWIPWDHGRRALALDGERSDGGRGRPLARLL